MRKTVVAILLSSATLLAGCGDSIHWFPGNGSVGGGTTPDPAPSGDTATNGQVQCDTDIKFNPYTVTFGNNTSSTTTASISVGGDVSSQYSKDNGTTFTSTAGTVKRGDIVIVKQTSSIYGPNRIISTVLYLGGTSATYSSTTCQLSFATRQGVSAGSVATSDVAAVPASLPKGFTFPATISLASDSDSSSKMYINGSSTQAASGSPIKATDTLYFKHTASSSATTLTHAILTGSNNVIYDVTFKSTLP